MTKFIKHIIHVASPSKTIPDRIKENIIVYLFISRFFIRYAIEKKGKEFPAITNIEDSYR
jgi:hypothetical protein